MICKNVYCAGTTPALMHARQYLKDLGVTVTDSPQWNTGHLLLDVPSFRPGSFLCDKANLDTLLGSLPHDTVIWGGNLGNLDAGSHRTVDLLQDEIYLSENAAITAHCALQIAASKLGTTWRETPTLIIGWGRIGKCLAGMLKSLDCPVTVAARQEAHLASLGSLGYRTVATGALSSVLPRFRLIFNTVPSSVLTADDCSVCNNCVKIDLASIPGIEGKDVIHARGLPGIHAPESSGKMIASRFLQLVKEAEQ